MVPPVDQRELHVADLAHRHPLVGDPDGRGVADVSLHPGQRVQLVRREEGGLLVAVLLDGAVQRVQPLVTLLHVTATRIMNEKRYNTTIINEVGFSWKILLQ